MTTSKEIDALRAEADEIAALRPDPRTPAVVRASLLRPSRLTLRRYLELEECGSPFVTGAWPSEPLDALRAAADAWAILFPAERTPAAETAAGRIAAEGKAAVGANILKVMRPGRGERIYDGDPAVLHKRFRASRGRVLMRLKKNGQDRRIRVTRSVLMTYIKDKQEKVGWLAAGWNAAARELWARIPTFAAKHGSGFGAIRVRLSGNRMFIEMRNQVRFAKAVRDLQRRVNFALGRRADALSRQLEHIVKKKTK